MDVSTLIESWTEIRLTVPRPELTEQIAPGERVVNEIYHMSRRKDSWEAFICLQGYCGLTESDPNEVLRVVEADILAGSERDSTTVQSFLSYSAPYITIEPSIFLAASIRVRTLLAGDLIITRASALDTLQECRAQYEPDWDKVWKCVRKAGGGRSASAAGGGRSASAAGD